jgi:hypothetical protein
MEAWSEAWNEVLGLSIPPPSPDHTLCQWEDNIWRTNASTLALSPCGEGQLLRVPGTGTLILALERQPPVVALSRLLRHLRSVRTALPVADLSSLASIKRELGDRSCEFWENSMDLACPQDIFPRNLLAALWSMVIQRAKVLEAQIGAVGGTGRASVAVAGPSALGPSIKAIRQFVATNTENDLAGLLTSSPFDELRGSFLVLHPGESMSPVGWMRDGGPMERAVGSPESVPGATLAADALVRALTLAQQEQGVARPVVSSAWLHAHLRQHSSTDTDTATAPLYVLPRWLFALGAGPLSMGLTLPPGGGDGVDGPLAAALRRQRQVQTTREEERVDRALRHPEDVRLLVYVDLYDQPDGNGHDDLLRTECVWAYYERYLDKKSRKAPHLPPDPPIREGVLVECFSGEDPRVRSIVADMETPNNPWAFAWAFADSNGGLVLCVSPQNLSIRAQTTTLARERAGLSDRAGTPRRRQEPWVDAARSLGDHGYSPPRAHHRDRERDHGHPRHPSERHRQKQGRRRQLPVSRHGGSGGGGVAESSDSDAVVRPRKKKRRIQRKLISDDESDHKTPVAAEPSPQVSDASPSSLQSSGAEETDASIGEIEAREVGTPEPEPSDGESCGSSPPPSPPRPRKAVLSRSNQFLDQVAQNADARPGDDEDDDGVGDEGEESNLDGFIVDEEDELASGSNSSAAETSEASFFASDEDEGPSMNPAEEKLALIQTAKDYEAAYLSSRFVRRDARLVKKLVHAYRGFDQEKSGKDKLQAYKKLKREVDLITVALPRDPNAPEEDETEWEDQEAERRYRTTSRRNPGKSKPRREKDDHASPRRRTENRARSVSPEQDRQGIPRSTVREPKGAAHRPGGLADLWSKSKSKSKSKKARSRSPTRAHHSPQGPSRRSRSPARDRWRDVPPCRSSSATVDHLASGTTSDDSECMSPVVLESKASLKAQSENRAADWSRERKAFRGTKGGGAWVDACTDAQVEPSVHHTRQSLRGVLPDWILDGDGDRPSRAVAAADAIRLGLARRDPRVAAHGYASLAQELASAKRSDPFLFDGSGLAQPGEFLLRTVLQTVLDRGALHPSVAYTAVLLALQQACPVSFETPTLPACRPVASLLLDLSSAQWDHRAAPRKPPPHTVATAPPRRSRATLFPLPPSRFPALGLPTLDQNPRSAFPGEDARFQLLPGTPMGPGARGTVTDASASLDLWMGSSSPDPVWFVPRVTEKNAAPVERLPLSPRSVSTWMAVQVSPLPPGVHAGTPLLGRCWPLVPPLTVVAPAEWTAVAAARPRGSVRPIAAPTLPSPVSGPAAPPRAPLWARVLSHCPLTKGQNMGLACALALISDACPRHPSTRTCVLGGCASLAHPWVRGGDRLALSAQVYLDRLLAGDGVRGKLPTPYAAVRATLSDAMVRSAQHCQRHIARVQKMRRTPDGTVPRLPRDPPEDGPCSGVLTVHGLGWKELTRRHVAAVHMIDQALPRSARQSPRLPTPGPVWWPQAVGDGRTSPNFATILFGFTGFLPALVRLPFSCDWGKNTHKDCTTRSSTREVVSRLLSGGSWAPPSEPILLDAEAGPEWMLALQGSYVQALGEFNGSNAAPGTAPKTRNLVTRRSTLQSLSPVVALALSTFLSGPRDPAPSRARPWGEGAGRKPAPANPSPPLPAPSTFQRPRPSHPREVPALPVVLPATLSLADCLQLWRSLRDVFRTGGMMPVAVLVQALRATGRAEEGLLLPRALQTWCLWASQRLCALARGTGGETDPGRDPLLGHVVRAALDLIAGDRGAFVREPIMCHAGFPSWPGVHTTVEDGTGELSEPLLSKLLTVGAPLHLSTASTTPCSDWGDSNSAAPGLAATTVYRHGHPRVARLMVRGLLPQTSLYPAPAAILTLSHRLTLPSKVDAALHRQAAGVASELGFPVQDDPGQLPHGRRWQAGLKARGRFAEQVAAWLVDTGDYDHPPRTAVCSHGGERCLGCAECGGTAWNAGYTGSCGAALDGGGFVKSPVVPLEESSRWWRPTLYSVAPWEVRGPAACAPDLRWLVRLAKELTAGATGPWSRALLLAAADALVLVPAGGRRYEPSVTSEQVDFCPRLPLAAWTGEQAERASAPSFEAACRLGLLVAARGVGGRGSPENTVDASGRVQLAEGLHLFVRSSFSPLHLIYLSAAVASQVPSEGGPQQTPNDGEGGGVGHRMFLSAVRLVALHPARPLVQAACHWVASQLGVLLAARGPGILRVPRPGGGGRASSLQPWVNFVLLCLTAEDVSPALCPRFVAPGTAESHAPMVDTACTWQAQEPSAGGSPRLWRLRARARDWAASLCTVRQCFLSPQEPTPPVAAAVVAPGPHGRVARLIMGAEAKNPTLWGAVDLCPAPRSLAMALSNLPLVVRALLAQPLGPGPDRPTLVLTTEERLVRVWMPLLQSGPERSPAGGHAATVLSWDPRSVAAGMYAKGRRQRTDLLSAETLLASSVSTRCRLVVVATTDPRATWAHQFFAQTRWRRAFVEVSVAADATHLGAATRHNQLLDPSVAPLLEPVWSGRRRKDTQPASGLLGAVLSHQSQGWPCAVWFCPVRNQAVVPWPAPATSPVSLAEHIGAVLPGLDVGGVQVVMRNDARLPDLEGRHLSPKSGCAWWSHREQDPPPALERLEPLRVVRVLCCDPFGDYVGQAPSEGATTTPTPPPPDPATLPRTAGMFQAHPAWQGPGTWAERAVFTPLHRDLLRPPHPAPHPRDWAFTNPEKIRHAFAFFQDLRLRGQPSAREGEAKQTRAGALLTSTLPDPPGGYSMRGGVAAALPTSAHDQLTPLRQMLRLLAHGAGCPMLSRPPDDEAKEQRPPTSDMKEDHIQPSTDTTCTHNPAVQHPLARDLGLCAGSGTAPPPPDVLGAVTFADQIPSTPADRTQRWSPTTQAFRDGFVLARCSSQPPRDEWARLCALACSPHQGVSLPEVALHESVSLALVGPCSLEPSPPRPSAQAVARATVAGVLLSQGLLTLHQADALALVQANQRCLVYLSSYPGLCRLWRSQVDLPLPVAFEVVGSEAACRAQARASSFLVQTSLHTVALYRAWELSATTLRDTCPKGSPPLTAAKHSAREKRWRNACALLLTFVFFAPKEHVPKLGKSHTLLHRSRASAADQDRQQAVPEALGAFRREAWHSTCNPIPWRWTLVPTAWAMLRAPRAATATLQRALGPAGGGTLDLPPTLEQVHPGGLRLLVAVPGDVQASFAVLWDLCVAWGRTSPQLCQETEILLCVPDAWGAGRTPLATLRSECLELGERPDILQGCHPNDDELCARIVATSGNDLVMIPWCRPGAEGSAEALLHFQAQAHPTSFSTTKILVCPEDQLGELELEEVPHYLLRAGDPALDVGRHLVFPEGNCLCVGCPRA